MDGTASVSWSQSTHGQRKKPGYDSRSRFQEFPMRQNPTVLARETVASSRLFRGEEMQLRFSNDPEPTNERLVDTGSGYIAVIIGAQVDAEIAILVNNICECTA